MTDERGDVDHQVLLNALDKFIKRFPIPLNAFFKRDMRHFLDLIEHADEFHSVLSF